MELSSIRDAFDHVSKKRKLSSSNTQEMIDGIIREIENALAKMKTPLDEEGSSINGKSILSELSIKLKEMSPMNQLKEGLIDLGDYFSNEAQEPDAIPGVLQTGTCEDALKYAQTHLAPFTSVHMSEVQKLVVCLLWAGQLHRSPYAEFLSPNHWKRVKEDLTRQYCSLLGQSNRIPLGVTVAAGVQFLQGLFSSTILMHLDKQNLTTVGVNLDNEFQFHSLCVSVAARPGE
ncbi:hypothetical protein QJS10_CPA01g02281 [Acorus calamus]|uniref:CRA domain-containing protein n=1 Tax=Acorus calamus TaxID=4465 RepID=A0AAV9FJ88_ACOCL|nr:hypothetical protein QJS10_CPA01g02281 [Acorus calamus]